LDTLVTRRSAEGNSAQTVAHELTMLRASNLHAKAINLRAPLVTKWPLPMTEAKTRYLTLDEYCALVAALDPANASPAYRDEWQVAQDLVVALTMTGGRWSEVAGVTWAQVDGPPGASTGCGATRPGRIRMAPVTQALQGLIQRRYDSPRRHHRTLVLPNASG
jgi:integrase